MTAQNILEKLFHGGNSYWLTRFVIIRLLGFVYAVAFLVAAQQLVPLVGEHGLTPANHFFERVEAHFGSRSAAALQLPSLFWFGISDQGLSIFAWVGFGLSLVVLCGYANAILLAILWAMYMSIIHVGQIWYGYGWETQLLETGFLSIFLCPLLDGRPFPKCRPPLLVIWLFRWLGFRIMIGAGLIKLRGDPCWRDLTCLYYHYETQPIPSPVSRYLHFAPHWFHKFGTAWNHFIELIVPWFSFGPRHARHVAGILLVSFQIILIISGNLSFLNYVTIIPFLACFDDTFLRRILPRSIVKRAERAAQESEPSRINNTIAIALSLLVAYLSIAPVANLVSERQMMNTSFDRLSLVNTYGEVFEANIGDVEDDSLPTLTGPDGSSVHMLAMLNRLRPLFERLDARIESMALSGRGSRRLELDSGAAIELGRGSDDEVLARTDRFLATLTQVTGRYQRPLEYADLRHRDGYAVRLKGITTVIPATKDRKN